MSIFKITKKWKICSKKGFSLIEVLVSMLLISIIVGAFLGSLGTASKTLITTDEKETARNIAEMQLEYIKSQSWNSIYDPVAEIATNYPGYSVLTETDGKLHAEAINSRDTNIQKITVTVMHNDKAVFSIVGYKENTKS
jgi:prepilin-type N-terminal cleavage/methylation domain-containing protein